MFPPNLIDAKRIGCRLKIGSKKRVLQKLGDLLASSTPGLSPEEVFDHLLERERLGSRMAKKLAGKLMAELLPRP